MLKKAASYSGISIFHVNAFGQAILLECAVIALMITIYSILPNKPIVPKEPTVIQLMDAPEEPKPKAEPTPPPPKPIIKPVMKPEPIKPLPETSKPIPEPVKVPETPVAPTPFVEKPIEPPPPVVTPKSNEAEVLMEYTAKIRAAVQSALLFPKSAEAMGLTGRTRVEFTLFQGHQSQAKVITSSGVNMFDRAALQAVTDAAYPPLPDTIKNQARTFEIWVEFKK